jgi:hypothetical protein
MANFMTDKSITHIGIALPNEAPQEKRPELGSVTEILRRALIERPGEGGAFGNTWVNREAAIRQAAQFCQARPMDCVASANGDYHARVYELPGEMWGVVVWYDPVD